MSIHILIGNEVFFKERKIESILRNGSTEKESLSLDLDSTKNIEPLISDMFIHLSSFSFFGNTKVGILRTHHYSKVTEIFKYLKEVPNENILLIDVFEKYNKKSINSIKNNKNIKKLGVNIQNFFKLQNYEENKLIPFVRDILDSYDIKFLNEEDKEKSIDFIVKNSNLSYQNAFNETKKLQFLNNKFHTFESIASCISDNLCSDRYYILDTLLKSKDIEEIFQAMNKYILKLDTKGIEFLCADLISFIKDYIYYQNKVECLKETNYYKIKKLKFKLREPSLLISKFNELYSLARKNYPTTKDLLYLIVFENFIF